MRSLRDRRLGANTHTSGIVVPQLAINQKIALVSWTHTRDGWTSELLQAGYLSHDDDSWTVTIDGTTQTIPRDRWSLCAP